MEWRPSKAKSMKLCLFGDVGVGKTSLAHRFVTGMFSNRYIPTYHARHHNKYLDSPDGDIYIQMWDTSGANHFRSMEPDLLRDLDGAVLLYDVTHLPSFFSVQRFWLKWVKALAPADLRLVLVGNKVDRSASRQVTEQLGYKERWSFAQDNWFKNVFVRLRPLLVESISVYCERLRQKSWYPRTVSVRHSVKLICARAQNDLNGNWLMWMLAISRENTAKSGKNVEMVFLEAGYIAS
ncbi:hypothetical protein EGW08_010334 [Elysia chlorotica]|uniref:Uncharacterized protein n=1 Tax=Elysia chlorotica TaxID=188477 RepID=A0A433TJY0_ELYCH|nr:hypothetical protein EGW08_010334 [Elysia chlorotica]